MSESQCSCIFQEPMNRERNAYMDLWVKYAWRYSSCVSKIPPVVSKIHRTTVSMFLSTLQRTALLLKKIRPRLHCYSLLWSVSRNKQKPEKMSTVRSLSRTSGRGLGPVIYYSKVRLREGQVKRLLRLCVFGHHPITAHHLYAFLM